MKAVVLTAYVPDAWAVQIGSREVQIKLCWAAGQRAARQARRGWEKFPEYRK